MTTMTDQNPADLSLGDLLGTIHDRAVRIATRLVDGREISTDMLNEFRTLINERDRAQREAPERTTRYTCVYGKCAGAHVDAKTVSESDEWMDHHVATAPHSARWPVTFRVEYPGSSLPSADYRNPVLIDEDAL